MAAYGLAYLEPILQRSDIWISSKSEAKGLAGVTRLAIAAHQLSHYGPDVVMITLGKQGVFILDHGRSSRVPAYPVDRVVDTTGTGDAFSAGVITGMLEGLPWMDSARLGCAVASIKVKYPGSRGGLPDRNQVQKIIEGDIMKPTVDEVQN